MKALHCIFEFVFNNVNILIFIFLWVGVALVGSGASLDVCALLFVLMAGPAVLGYLIGRGK